MSGRIVSFLNPQAQALHCILEEPAGGAAGAPLAAVLLCPGVKTRVAPHRLYRKLSQAFLRRGIPVMRVDFRGLGDSEGEWADERLENIYRRIELGECVDDARSALDWLESQCRIRNFIVGGLCGAAITGLHLASRDARVAGLYAIGLPAGLHGAPSGTQESMTRGMLRSKRLLYVRKLFQPASWLRLFSMRSDYRLMARLLLDALHRPSFQGSAPAPFPAAPPSAARPAADLNPDLPPAFFTMLKAGVPALLIYGETDPMQWELQEKFLQPWAEPLAPYAGLLATAVISRASHTLAEPAAVAEAVRLTGEWLDARFSETRESGRQPPRVASAAA